MLRLRASELTLTSEDVEDTFRRMAERKAQDANRRVPQHLQHPLQSNRPILRQGPQRFVRDSITALGDIPILPQPHQVMIAHVDDESDDDDDEYNTAMPQRVDSVRGSVPHTPNSHPLPAAQTTPTTHTSITGPASASPSPAPRGLHLPFRLRRTPRTPTSQPIQSDQDAQGSSSNLAPRPPPETDGACDSTDTEESEQAHPELRGGADKRHEGADKLPGGAVKNDGIGWVLQNRNSTEPVRYLSGFFPPMHTFDPSRYEFEEFWVVPQTEPRRQPPRPPLPTRSHSTGHAPSQEPPRPGFSGPAHAALSNSAFQGPSTAYSGMPAAPSGPSSRTNQPRSTPLNPAASEYTHPDQTSDLQAMLDRATGRNTSAHRSGRTRPSIYENPWMGPFNATWGELPPQYQAPYTHTAGGQNTRDLPPAYSTVTPPSYDPPYAMSSYTSPFDPSHAPSQYSYNPYHQPSTTPPSSFGGVQPPFASASEFRGLGHNAGHGVSPHNMPRQNSPPAYQSRHSPGAQTMRSPEQPLPGFEHDSAQPGSYSTTARRQFSSEASANSGAYSLYELPPGSRQPSSQQPRPSANALSLADGTAFIRADGGGSYHSGSAHGSPNSHSSTQQSPTTTAVNGQHGVSPMPSRPYSRPSSVGEPAAFEYTADAATAVRQNLSSPLEAYSNHYVQHHMHPYAQQGQPFRPSVQMRPPEGQARTGAAQAPLTRPPVRQRPPPNAFDRHVQTGAALDTHFQQPTTIQGDQRAQSGSAPHQTLRYAAGQTGLAQIPPYRPRTADQGVQQPQPSSAPRHTQQYLAVPTHDTARTATYRSDRPISQGNDLNQQGTTPSVDRPHTSHQNALSQQNNPSRSRSQTSRGLPSPNPLLSHTPRDGAVNPGGPNAPSPGMRGGDTGDVTEFTGRSTRMNQRSSENAPVRPPPQSFGPSSNTQVQRHRAAFERLHNAELEVTAQEPDRSGSSAPRNTSNRLGPRNSLNDRMRRRVQNLHSPRLPPERAPPADTSTSLRGGAAVDRSYTRRRRATPVPPPVNNQPQTTHTRPATAVPVAVRSPLTRAMTLARQHRRVPQAQTEQENVGVEESVMREEMDAVLARYGVEGRGIEGESAQRLDETPPRVGRVESRMGGGECGVGWRSGLGGNG